MYHNNHDALLVSTVGFMLLSLPGQGLISRCKHYEVFMHGWHRSALPSSCLYTDDDFVSENVDFMMQVSLQPAYPSLVSLPLLSVVFSSDSEVPPHRLHSLP